MEDGKGFFSFVMIIAALFMLVVVFLYVFKDRPGGSQVSNETQEDIRSISQTSVRVYVDENTGVNYLIFDAFYQGGICPRYNADGTLYVEKDQIEE